MRQLVEPVRNDPVGLVVGDQHRIAGDGEAVHLSGDGDRVSARARDAADDRHFGAAARRKDFGKILVVEDGEHLFGHRGLFGRSKIRGGIGEIALGGILAPLGAEYPAALASADAPAVRARAPFADPPRSRRLVRSGKSLRRKPMTATAARNAAFRRAPVAAATPENRAARFFREPRQARCAATAPAGVRRNRKTFSPPSSSSTRNASSGPRTRSYQQRSGRLVRPSAPQMISRSAARVMAT